MNAIPGGFNTDFGDGNELTLVCPNCRESHTHHDTTTIVSRNEDGPASAVIVGHDAPAVRFRPHQPIDLPSNWNVRRDWVEVSGSCEMCDERWTLVIRQHKGNTFIRVIPEIAR